MGPNLLSTLDIANIRWEFLAYSVAIFIVAFGLRHFSTLLFRSKFRKITLHRRYLLEHFTSGFIVVLAIVALFILWAPNTSSIFGLLGMIGAGLAIANKEFILNFTAFFVIIWRELFTMGDRIEINGVVGDVIEKGPSYITLIEVKGLGVDRQSTGRMLKIPNNLVLLHPIVNYTRGCSFLWTELEFTLTAESNWKDAKELLLVVAKEQGEKWQVDHNKVLRDFDKIYSGYVVYRKLDPIVYTKVTAHGTQLTLRYLAPVRQIRDGSSFVSERFLEMVEEKDNIHLYYN